MFYSICFYDFIYSSIFKIMVVIFITLTNRAHHARLDIYVIDQKFNSRIPAHMYFYFFPSPNYKINQIFIFNTSLMHCDLILQNRTGCNNVAAHHRLTTKSKSYNVNESWNSKIFCTRIAMTRVLKV